MSGGRGNRPLYPGDAYVDIQFARYGRWVETCSSTDTVVEKGRVYDSSLPDSGRGIHTSDNDSDTSVSVVTERTSVIHLMILWVWVTLATEKIKSRIRKSGR